MGALFSRATPETDIKGYHILHVYENSPAKNAGLEGFFDFIVSFCGIVLTGNDDAFLDLLSKTKERELELKVFSLRTNRFRNVQIIPNIDSNGEISLGLTVQFREIENAYKYIHHVLEVLPNSPAYNAGLRPFSDYIIGDETDEVEDLNFMKLIEKYDLEPIKIFVYNSEENKCRAVIIEPNSKAMFENSLGCGIGTGCMHRIPLDFNGSSQKIQSLQYSGTFIKPEQDYLNFPKSLPHEHEFQRAYGYQTRYDTDENLRRAFKKNQISDFRRAEDTVV